MRILGAAAVLAVAGVLALPGSARAAEGCTVDAVEEIAKPALFDYADRHAGDFYDQYGGAAELGYERGTLLCRDLTGDVDREMIVRLICCTGGSPSPWGIFQHDRNGAWRLRYARPADTVFRLGVRRRAARATMPAPYEGACTRFVRTRVVRWSPSKQRFRSRTAPRRRVTTGC